MMLQSCSNSFMCDCAWIFSHSKSNYNAEAPSNKMRSLAVGILVHYMLSVTLYTVSVTFGFLKNYFWYDLHVRFKTSFDYNTFSEPFIIASLQFLSHWVVFLLWHSIKHKLLYHIHCHTILAHVTCMVYRILCECTSDLCDSNTLASFIRSVNEYQRLPLQSLSTYWGKHITVSTSGSRLK